MNYPPLVKENVGKVSCLDLQHPAPDEWAQANAPLRHKPQAQQTETPK
jgi:hypothetical protein